VPAEAAPKPPYKAGDLLRKEDFDPVRLPKGYSFEHGRITRVQKCDRPQDVLPEVWSSLTKAQKKVARKHYDDTVAADAAPMPLTTPGPSAGAALETLSTAEDVPGRNNSRPHDALTPVMPCWTCTGSLWKHWKSGMYTVLSAVLPFLLDQSRPKRLQRSCGEVRRRPLWMLNGISASNENMGGGQGS
jgi:hypothetical protein